MSPSHVSTHVTTQVNLFNASPHVELKSKPMSSPHVELTIQLMSKPMSSPHVELMSKPMSPPHHPTHVTTHVTTSPHHLTLNSRHLT